MHFAGAHAPYDSACYIVLRTERPTEASNGVYSYLLMTTGARSGTHFLLKPGVPTRIGRGLECDIVLSDPLSSRVHATVVFEDGEYWVRDAGSRNGSFVNGQKIDEARLSDGNLLRVGSSEFTYHQSAEPPVDRFRLDHTQTIVHDRIMGREMGPLSADSLQNSQSAQDLLTLHQLSIQLLGCTDPDEVIRPESRASDDKSPHDDGDHRKAVVYSHMSSCSI